MSKQEIEKEWKPSLQEGWDKVKILQHYAVNTSHIIHFEETADYIIIAVDAKDPLMVKLDKHTDEAYFSYVAPLKDRYDWLLQEDPAKLPLCQDGAASGMVADALREYLKNKTTKSSWKPNLQEGWQDVDVSGFIMFDRPISGLVHFEETDEYIIAGLDEEDPLYMRFDKNTQEGAWSWTSDTSEDKHAASYLWVATRKYTNTISEHEDNIVGDFFLALKIYVDNKKGNKMENNTENKIKEGFQGDSEDLQESQPTKSDTQETEMFYQKVNREAAMSEDQYTSPWNTNMLEIPEYTTVLVTGIYQCSADGTRKRFNVIGRREGSDFVPLQEDNYITHYSNKPAIPTFAENLQWMGIESPVVD